MPTLIQAVKRLSDRWLLPPRGTVSVKDLNQRFQPIPSGSMRSLLLKIDTLADEAQPVGGSTHPCYSRAKPTTLLRLDHHVGTEIDLTDAHLPSYGESNTVDEAVRLFDARAGAAIRAAIQSMREHGFRELLELKVHGDDKDPESEVPDAWIVRANALAVMAFPDYVPPGSIFSGFRDIVSQAILASNPGWCGTWGPGVDGTQDVLGDPSEGNYDMSQMHLLQIAYRYYDELSPEAREHLIANLLAKGRIHRPNRDDIFTSGGPPNDWSTAGMIEIPFIPFLDIKVMRIGETENHILTIHTARYLTNQLLYQRDHDPQHDNRRNGSGDSPSCTELMLGLLRNILRDDFSEYNAKNYQSETQHALLNLCSYAYDHEIRLAARMVLDYVSAHLAVSSSDLRRMVPFRRRNEGKNVTRDPRGFMDVSLVETTTGADPMAQHFAILAGNTRIYEARGWRIKTDEADGNDAMLYALSDYRLPPAIHDLFVNDLHRRFFQRLHRLPQDDVAVTGRNCDNHEINAGSPSYLITAGGTFATWAIDPGPVSLSAKLRRKNDQQLGVAVTTSFMPTTRPNFDCGDPTLARDLIQFGRFTDVEGVINYGVAPDFACGPQVNSPDWLEKAIAEDAKVSGDAFGKFKFVNKGSTGNGPGFFLAFLRDGDFAVMEAFDTWLHPDLKFEQFKSIVFAANRELSERGIKNNVEDQYMTISGNVVHFKIWNFGDDYGANVLEINYGDGNPVDSFGDASQATNQFLHGTVMNSLAEGVVEITNHFLGTKITLDMNDPWHPRRTSETGEIEEAGSNHEVWVDFGWKGSSEGDFYRPFNTHCCCRRCG
jgi:hypothetical protein